MNILDNVCGYPLDKEQREVVLCKNKNVLVSAGAGSGKSLTIIGKIRYLVEIDKVNIKDILVISFTNDTVNSLKNKLLDNYNYDIDVFTFHKLGLNILENVNYHIDIISSDYLEYIVLEYFNGLMLNNIYFQKKLLKYFKVKDTYINFINNDCRFREFTKLVIRFISLFRSNNLSINDFYNILISNRNKLFGKKKVFLLRIILDIYLIYIDELKSSGKIDFDDMIIEACKNIDNINFNYKYIIIDEYQDTSLVKFNMIEKLVDKMNSNLLVVGDDFQSIYRFTGCSLDLFLNFDKMFDDVKTFKLTNTYRCCYELINISGKFIMKNKYQIKKELKSNKHIYDPLYIIYTKNNVDCLIKLILKNKDKEIMIIGRNNFDIYKYIDNRFKLDNNNLIYINDTSIKIRYLTAHRSKGLESDVVIIINMIDDIFGFPNKI